MRKFIVLHMELQRENLKSYVTDSFRDKIVYIVYMFNFGAKIQIIS